MNSKAKYKECNAHTTQRITALIENFRANKYNTRFYTDKYRTDNFMRMTNPSLN